MTRPSEKEAVARLAAAISKSTVTAKPMVSYDRTDHTIAVDVPAIVRAMREIDGTP